VYLTEYLTRIRKKRWVTQRHFAGNISIAHMFERRTPALFRRREAQPYASRK
jgi:hypothetical protein